ncbi:hypothetical protein FPSM_00617 [Flavobacterium psychrophilum]|nr:hypothetical protein FPSM_00617 [Flavobacterium psychrophilum]
MRWKIEINTKTAGNSRLAKCKTKVELKFRKEN